MLGAEQVPAAIRIVEWVNAGVLVGATAIAARRYLLTRRRFLVFLMAGLALLAFAQVTGLAYTALFYSVFGPFTEENVARSVPFSNGIILVTQVLRFVGYGLLGLSAIKAGQG